MTKRKAPEDLLPRGRPSEFDPAYCERLVMHMIEGLSFESFAAELGVSEATLYNWRAAQPEFLEAWKRGRPQSRLWWERLGQQGTQGLGPQILRKETVRPIKGKTKDGKPATETIREYGAAQFNVTGWIFNIVNRFPDEWKRYQPMDAAKLSDEQVLAAFDEALRRMAKDPESLARLEARLAAAKQENPSLN